MTELATYEESGVLPSPAAALATVQDQAVRRLAEWAQSADAAYHVAQRLVQSSFVPVAFRGKPMEATAAILAGMEIGLSPMSALRAFDVIQGQAAPRALTLRAVVQSYGHQMVLVESTSTRCRMRGRRKGEHEWQSVTWTIDRARELGLAGKENWRKQPAAMLVARATSELARLIAADAILGIGISAEEIADGGVGGGLEPPTVDVPVSDPAPAAPQPGATGTRRMSRAKRQPAPTETEPSAETEPPEPAESGPDPITQAQLRKLHASLTDIGITERADRMAYVSSVLRREVGSSSELTKDEASRLIDEIEKTAMSVVNEADQ